MKETNEMLVLKYQQGQSTFEDVYRQCCPLIYKEANRWQIKGLDYDDKISILLEAFLEACDRYDKGVGVKFSTFCVNHLRYRIREHWRKATQLSSSKYQVLSVDGVLALKDRNIFEAGLIKVGTDAYQSFLDQEIEGLVKEGLKLVQEPAQSYVRQYLFEDMTKSEIARLENQTAQNIQYHINKSLKVIRTHLAQKGYTQII